jgi:hypothetical protein
LQAFGRKKTGFFSVALARAVESPALKGTRNTESDKLPYGSTDLFNEE